MRGLRAEWLIVTPTEHVGAEAISFIAFIAASHLLDNTALSPTHQAQIIRRCVKFFVVFNASQFTSFQLHYNIKLGNKRELTYSNVYFAWNLLGNICGQT